MTTRVQIPAYTDRWMMGDRYGEILKISRYGSTKNSLVRAARERDVRYSGGGIEVATVRLDKSGKTVKVILADCEVVD